MKIRIDGVWLMDLPNNELVELLHAVQDEMTRREITFVPVVARPERVRHVSPAELTEIIFPRKPHP